MSRDAGDYGAAVAAEATGVPGRPGGRGGSGSAGAAGPPGGRTTRDPAVLAWMRLARVFQQISRAAGSQVRAAGLSLAQFDVLAKVGVAEGCSQRDLAEVLLVTKGNVTQILDRMEACGLLRRRQEGRTKCVFLTEEGRALWQRVVPDHQRVIAERLGALTPAEQRDLLRLLGKLDRSLRSASPSRGGGRARGLRPGGAGGPR